MEKAIDEEYRTFSIHQLNADLPYCECPDWKKFQLPCKHILAIFAKYERDWNHLPASYRNSPYFTVDYDFIDARKPSVQQEKLEVADSENVLSGEESENKVQVHLMEIPKKIYPKRSKASVCREMLKELKDLTYAVRNVDSFEILEEQLSNILETFRKKAPSDDGPLLESKPFQRVRRQTSSYGPLPVPKKMKSKFTGRVGRANDERKRHSKIDMKEITIRGSQMLEEPVPVDDVAKYDHPIVLTDDKPSEVSNVRKRKTQQQKGKDADADTDEAVITKIVTSAEKDTEKRKVRKLHLSDVEVSHINNHEMITDESIDLAQQLLAKQFPVYDGFADIALSEQNGFEPIMRRNPFIQVLNTGSLHWICVSNLKTSRNCNDTCYVYDSLSNGKITPSVTWKISNMLYCQEKPEIKVLIQSVQQQTNSVDCGLFAVAFATSLVFGANPSNATYDQKLMRRHFLTCLEKKVMEPFPESYNRTRTLKCPSKELSIELFCICRQPYDPKESMAECIGVDSRHLWKNSTNSFYRQKI